MVYYTLSLQCLHFILLPYAPTVMPQCGTEGIAIEAVQKISSPNLTQSAMYILFHDRKMFSIYLSLGMYCV